MSLKPGLNYSSFAKIPLDKCQPFRDPNAGNLLTFNLYYDKIITVPYLDWALSALNHCIGERVQAQA